MAEKCRMDIRSHLNAIKNDAQLDQPERAGLATFKIPGRVKELRRLLGRGRSLRDSAWMAKMSEKTARKYRDGETLPPQQTTARNYRTRTDPFAGVWDPVQQRLELESRLKARTLFEWLQQTHAGPFPVTAELSGLKHPVEY